MPSTSHSQEKHTVDEGDVITNKNTSHPTYRIRGILSGDGVVALSKGKN